MKATLLCKFIRRPLVVAFLSLCLCAAGCGDGSDEADPSQSGDPVLDGSEAVSTPPAPSFAGSITDFLWKPRAESAYNRGLLVIHASPCNLDVVVNGEHLRDYGSGNGRCVTARSTTRSGCGYGNNVRVEIFDTITGLPYLFPDGNPFYIIPYGCNRTEFRL